MEKEMGDRKNEIVQAEKLIIIGVCGPLGSGCTTVAKFLADRKYEGQEGLQSYLEKHSYIKNGKINFDKYEENIETFYRRRTEIDKEIVEITRDPENSSPKENRKKLEEPSSEAEELHGKLKDTLEQREVIESLDYLIEAEQEDHGILPRFYIRQPYKTEKSLFLFNPYEYDREKDLWNQDKFNRVQ
ncbi:MAG: hypothetical protein JRJ83_14415 [Deltaproteobacteria bacterium]|nr:hypothetical protein [Deltaproteobacteria bacterium]